MDESYANALGVDTKNPDHFLFVQPDTLEEGMQVIRDLNSSGEIGLVLFDSVAAMTPEKMFANEVGKSTFALKAKLMSDALKVLKTEFYRTGCIGIFLNHVIDSSPMGQKLSSQGIKRTTTPGGKALKYYASIRVEFKPVGSIRGKVHNDLTGETEDMVVSQKVEAYVIKNKVAPPFKKGELRVNFGRGFSQAHAAMVVLTGRGLIKKEAAGIYRFNEQTQPPWMNIAEDPKSNWIKGEAALIEQIESSPEWQDKLMALATEALAAEAPKKVAAPPVEDEGPTPEELDALLEEEPV
jgi:recombination protein RecA